MDKNNFSIYIAAVFILFFAKSSAMACSLALHDWQLKVFFKIPIESPVFPMSEISVIKNHFKSAVTDKIFWITKDGRLTPLFHSVLSAVGGWTSSVSWVGMKSDKSIIKLAGEYSALENKPIFVSTDKNILKIAVFLDANSKNRCFQLVVAQDSRIRCIYLDPAAPWAQEYNIGCWVSLISHGVPFPGNVLSLSTYPVDGNRLSIYEDHPLVESLLAEGILMRRPDLVVDPYSFDFPDLPK